MKFDMNPFDSVRDAVTLLDFLNKAKTADEAAKIRALLEKQGVRICWQCKGTKQNRRRCETCKDTRDGIVYEDNLKAYQRNNLVPVMQDCWSCKGMGQKNYRTCTECDGKGQLYKRTVGLGGKTYGGWCVCPDCNGTCEVSVGACDVCNGTGTTR